MRIIEITAPAGHEDSVRAIAETYGARDIWTNIDEGQSRCIVRLLVDRHNQQKIIDACQSLFGGTDTWRLVLIPVEGVVTAIPAAVAAKIESRPTFRRSATVTREELYLEMVDGGQLTSNYLLFVLLATIVAGIGLVTNSVAVIIGAMVIAPLLGPTLAFSFGSVLGDRVVIWRSGVTLGIGLGLAIGLPAIWAFLFGVDVTGSELQARTLVGFDAFVLALASGAAAVLSISSGTASALVGVMVAVALLPPAVVSGFLLGLGNFEAGMKAATLLAVNLASVGFAAQIVFLYRGLRPRTLQERKGAKGVNRVTLVAWAILIAALVILIGFSEPYGVLQEGGLLDDVLPDGVLEK